MNNPFKLSAYLTSEGWRQIGESLRNDRLGAELRHVQVTKPDGSPIYDQPIVDERPGGAITVAVDTEGNIALIEVFRPAVAPADSDFSWPLSEEELSQLGAYSFEVPRGFPKKDATADQTAIDESAEELGHAVISVQEIGMVNCNTAYFVRRIPVYRAIIDRSRLSDLEQDVNEKIRAAVWFTPTELSEAIVEGKIFCSLTLGSLALYGACLTASLLGGD